MANYDYDDYDSPSLSRSASPSPPDGRIHLPPQASISDILPYLRRRAKDAPTDERSRHRQQQQQEVRVINLDHRIPPTRRPAGTTGSRCLFIYGSSHCPAGAAATAASPPRCRNRANNTATPYHRAEHHERRSNRGHRPSLAPQDSDQGATKVVCLANMLSLVDRLEDDGFYQDFLEDVTKEARKYGELVEVVIPRPNIGARAAPVVAGVGKVFLEYAHLGNAAWCRTMLDGRWYNGKEIAATFFSHGRFTAGDYA